MVLARGILSAVLAAGSLAIAAERAAADHIGRTLPAFGPALEPVGLILAVTSVDEMNSEMRKAYIRGIQEALAAHRYAPGPIDGILGPKTRLAIREYQRDAGRPVTGVASKELLDHLKFAQPKVYAKPKPEPDVTVLEVQTRLKVRGYYRGELDGLLGGETREAVRAYRQDAGLPVNGAIDWPLIESLRPAETQEAGGSAEGSAGGAPVPEPADALEDALEDAQGEPAPDEELLNATPPPAE